MKPTKRHLESIIRQSLRDLDQVCREHTGLSHRQIYNWLCRNDHILPGQKYYLVNPIDAYESLFCISWEKMHTHYTPHLKKWDRREFVKDVERTTEPGREAQQQLDAVQELEVQAKRRFLLNAEKSSQKHGNH